MQLHPRNSAIAGSVVALHVAALWALQAGLVHRAGVEVLVPVAMLGELVTPPAPEVKSPPAPPPPEPRPVQRPAQRQAPPAPAAPQPVAIADPAPAPTAPAGVVAAQPPAPPAAIAAAAPAAPPTAPPAAPARVEPPSSDADYLRNPKPPYPPISRRLGEQGKVLVRVLIGADGVPQQTELRQSSGFERLDQAALATALRWRYVPGKRGGVAETMWFTVPMIFLLEQ